MENTTLFYTISFLIFAFLLIFVICKNLFNAIITSIPVFILTSFIFYLLKTEYNAIIQLAVYGIAIPIILGLSIMFNHVNKYKKNENLSQSWNYILVTIGGLLLTLCFYVVIVKSGLFDFHFYSLRNNNTFNLISSMLFTHYIVVFELISIILTIAIIGFSLFKKEVKK